MNIIFEFLLTALYAIVFIFIIFKISFFKLNDINKRTLAIVFFSKVIIGTLLALIYTYYYPDRLKADVFKYFDDSKVMFDALFSRPLDYFKMLFGIRNDSPYFDQYYTQMNNWYRQYESNIYNDSHIIIRFNAFVRLFSFGYFGVHTVFMSFVALAGQTALFKFFRENTNLEPVLLFIASFLLPSVIFWSSGVLKEGLLFFGIGFLVYFSYKLLTKFDLISFCWVIFSFLLLAYLKFYITVALFPLLLTHYWCLKTNNRKVLFKYLLVLTIVLFCGFNFHHVFKSYNLPEIIVNKQNDFYYLALDQNSGSIIGLEKLTPDFFSIIKNTPKALFNVIFIPHVFQKQSLLSRMSSFENLFFLLLIFVIIFFVKSKNINTSFFYFCFFFVITTFILIGLITPVYGAIVRYKTPALPFLFVLLLLMCDTQAIKEKMKLLLKKNKK